MGLTYCTIIILSPSQALPLLSSHPPSLMLPKFLGHSFEHVEIDTYFTLSRIGQH